VAKQGRDERQPRRPSPGPLSAIQCSCENVCLHPNLALAPACVNLYRHTDLGGAREAGSLCFREALPAWQTHPRRRRSRSCAVS
jgi:hypothetical protein